VLAVRVLAHGHHATSRRAVVAACQGLGCTSKHLRPVSITGLVPAGQDLSSAARSEVKNGLPSRSSERRLVGVPGNAPGSGTDLVRFRL